MCYLNIRFERSGGDMRVGSAFNAVRGISDIDLPCTSIKALEPYSWT